MLGFNGFGNIQPLFASPNWFSGRPPMTMTAEQEAMLRSIRKLVDFWQITPEELYTDEPCSPVRPIEPPLPTGPKYKHPITGDIWDGQGSQPPWIREALTKEGYTVEELRIAQVEPESPGAD